MINTKADRDAGAFIYHSKSQEQRIVEAEEVLRKHRAEDPSSYPGGIEAYKEAEQLLLEVVEWMRTPEAEVFSKRELERLQTGPRISSTINPIDADLSLNLFKPGSSARADIAVIKERLKTIDASTLALEWKKL